MNVYRKVGFVYNITKGSTGWHVTSIDLKEMRDFCSCIGWLTHRKCKHVKSLWEVVLNMAIPIGKVLNEGREVFREFPSSLKVLNDMFGGNAYSANELFGVYALPNTGKTLLALQETAFLTSKGYKVLYIETEGGTEKMMKKWLPILVERFGGDYDKIFFESRKTLESLARYMGFEISFVTKQVNEEEVQSNVLDWFESEDVQDSRSKKKRKRKEDKAGKIEVIYRPLDISLIEDDIKRYGIDFIILDSLTAPIRAAFPPDQQNNPAKAFVESRILQKFIELQEKYNVGVMIIMHASFNPARPYDTTVNFRGGLAVRHAIKRIVYIAKRDARDFEDYRKFWLIRASDAKPWSKVGVAKITDLGYIDVPREEWENVFTPSELKRVNELGILSKKDELEEKIDDIIGGGD